MGFGVCKNLGMGRVVLSQNSCGQILKVLCAFFPLQAQETLNFFLLESWIFFSQPEEFSAATAPQELLRARSQKFFREAGKTIPWSIPKKFWMDLDRFREILKGSLWNSTQSWILTDRTTRLFPWEFFFFPACFSRFFFSLKSIFFPVIPSLLGGTQPLLFRAAVQHFKGVFWPFPILPRTRKNLGNFGFMNWEYLRCSLSCQNVPESVTSSTQKKILE